MLVTDNVSGTCRSRMAVRFILCRVFITDMLLQDSCIRPIRVRSKVIILNITDNLGPNMTYVHIGSKLITKNEADSYIPIFLVLLFFCLFFF